MREKKSFGQRTQVLKSDEVKRKYFLVYEGKATEDIYFEAVNNNRNKIGINPLIELVPIVRSYSEENWSNPQKIVDRVIKNLQETSSGNISYETLLNCIMSYFIDNNCLHAHRISKRNVWTIMVDICTKYLSVRLNDIVNATETACNQILSYLAKESGIEHVIDKLPELIEDNAITYDKNIDKICLIIDRDKDSFISAPYNNQYAYVQEKCIEHNFGFYLSNPCFEFWLLLHFDKVFDLDKQKLLDNPKVNSSKRYVESELKKILGNYKKTRYDTTIFINQIDQAIQNEKSFCEDAAELEFSLGSRIGLLIEEMRS